MSTEREKKVQAPLTGKQYNSVEEMMTGESVSAEVRNSVSELESQTNVVRNLVEMRRASGMTQEQLAKKLGVTQGAISKLESSLDTEITLGELVDYVKATEQSLMFNIGKAMNDMEFVKWHASGIRTHLRALAKAARQDSDVEQTVQAFFGEAFFNLLSILSKCHQELPKNPGVQVRLKRFGGSISSPKPPSYLETSYRLPEPDLV